MSAVRPLTGKKFLFAFCLIGVGLSSLGWPLHQAQAAGSYYEDAVKEWAETVVVEVVKAKRVHVAPERPVSAIDHG